MVIPSFMMHNVFSETVQGDMTSMAEVHQVNALRGSTVGCSQRSILTSDSLSCPSWTANAFPGKAHDLHQACCSFASC